MNQVDSVLASVALGRDLRQSIHQGMVVKTTILKEAVNALGVMAIAGGMWNGIVGLSRQRRQDIRQARVEPLIRQICRRSDASSPNLGRVGKIEIRC